MSSLSTLVSLGKSADKFKDGGFLMAIDGVSLYQS